MLWDADLLLSKDVIIGYNTGDMVYRNIHLEDPPFSTVDSRYRPDQMVGNTGLKGQWVMRLEMNTLSTLNHKSQCLDWYNR